VSAHIADVRERVLAPAGGVAEGRWRWPGHARTCPPTHAPQVTGEGLADGRQVAGDGQQVAGYGVG